MRFSVRRMLLLGVLLVALSGLLTGLRQVHQRAEADAVRPSYCDRYTRDQAGRAAADSGTGPRVVVIGDSWSVGLGLAAPQDSWPVRLPGRVHVDGFSGSGFSAEASPCGPVAYFERAAGDVREDPALVVVEGGLNDVDQPSAAITAGFHQLMARLHGHRVVVVGPPMAPSRASGVPRVDRLLATLCDRARVPYLSTVGLRLTYQDDRLHPDRAGADAFGVAVATFIAAHP